jgi:hypothetical protein
VTVSNEALPTYLNDHLAASVAAIELIERMLEAGQGTALGSFLTGLHKEIEADQESLRDLLHRRGAGESRLKQAGAWLSEKASRVKLGGSDKATPLGRLENLETLALGVQGKSGLWRALRAVSSRHPELAGFDLNTLEQRAADQYTRIEAQRLEAARDAL